MCKHLIHIIWTINLSDFTLNCFLYFQGLMFGYATDETDECMPLTVVLAHKLNSRIAELRRNGVMAWARPDSKTQVCYIVPIYCLTDGKYVKFCLKSKQLQVIYSLLNMGISLDTGDLRVQNSTRSYHTNTCSHCCNLPSTF